MNRMFVLLFVLSCGSAKPPAKPVAQPAESSDAGSVDTALREEPAAEQVSCTGNALELVRALSQAACEEKDRKTAEHPSDMKDKLSVSVTPANLQTKPGERVDFTLEFKNTSKGPLPLYFLIDSEPRFSFELTDAKGKRADIPPGKEPKLPDGIAEEKPLEQHAAKVTLAPGGTGHVKLSWEAAKLVWAPAEKAKGALPGRGYPKVSGGPLAPGKYTLRITTPLLGAMEGADKEVSTIKVPVEVTKK